MYTVWYYFWFQASFGGLAMSPAQIRGTNVLPEVTGFLPSPGTYTCPCELVTH